ncbi:MAG: pyridoxal phosphate-dependent aminotransferase [Deltaproteobacteria bacterium]|nr:pyridoxal phosphate-dependent aminotransferase [Deltaproteobacteria bacterium]MBW2123344.1 pyridoxal phosphate-dependent aminotransferase [Deltaproteobacteria bacterium]
MKYASRMSRMETDTASAFEIYDRAQALEAEGRDIIHLEIGEPDFDTPEHIREAGIEAIRRGFTHYSSGAGMMAAREAIARFVARERGIEVTPQQVIITPGGKPALFYGVCSCVDEGGEVILPSPGFPVYEAMVLFAGGKPVHLPLREEIDFGFDIEELRALVTDRTRMIIINSPQNPTGAVLTGSQLEAIADLATERDFFVLADEVYSKILYDATYQSIVGLPGMAERTILVDSFSKAYAMTGWRLGYAVAAEETARHIATLMVNSNSCTASFTQIAGIEALRGPQDCQTRMIEEFRKRRDFLVEGINRIPGISCRTPQGAFYVFANISKLEMGSALFSNRLLEEAGVGTMPGISFGRHGEGFVRISYANSLERIARALERLEDFVRADGHRTGRP